LKYPVRLDEGLGGTYLEGCGLVHSAAKGVAKFNIFNETIQRCLDIVGVDDCNQLVIAVKKEKEHDDKMKEVLV
jgi:hypothetical protein